MRLIVTNLALSDQRVAHHCPAWRSLHEEMSIKWVLFWESVTEHNYENKEKQ